MSMANQAAHRQKIRDLSPQMSHSMTAVTSVKFKWRQERKQI